MSAARDPRRRVALVDLQLGDCDHLVSRLGGRIEVALVVAPDGGAPLARWAEVAGYPWATDLEALTAVVADVVAVGEGSPRRHDALALATALGARGTIFSAASDVPTREQDPLARLDDALATLFAVEESPPAESNLWQPARDAGFVAGLLLAAGPGERLLSRLGDAAAADWLLPLARHARRAPRGWAQMSIAEGGLWRAWCALAANHPDGPVVGLGGRLLPALGYGPPGGRGQEAQRDRRLAERLLREAGVLATP